MTKALYVTFDYLDKFSGAGQVCINEIDALGKVADTVEVLEKIQIGDKIDRFYGFNPYLYDYFASTLLNCEDIDLAHLSCSPANAILSKLKPKHYVTNCPAHNLEESIKEHEHITGTPYPFAHNTDPYLRETLWRHLKDADAVITPSNGSRDWIQDNIKPKRVVVIPHGVNLPERTCTSDRFTNVGYIGAWGPDKGLKYLIEAWSRLNYEDSTLTFFGREAEQMEPVLRHWATGGKYRLYGEYASLDEIMPQFSVLVHPSVSEGYGMTTVEVMSYGKVVVVSTGTGSSMNVVNGVNGFTFPPRDVGALMWVINELKTNYPSYSQVGAKARETAESLSWEKIKQMYIKLYEEILK